MNQRTEMYKLYSYTLSMMIRIIADLLGISKEVLYNELAYNIECEPDDDVVESLRNAITHRPTRNLPKKYFKSLSMALSKTIEKHKQDIDEQRLYILNDLQSMVKKFPYFHSNFGEPVYDKMFQPDDTVQDLSPQFLFRIQKSFNAFQTLQINDVIVLGILFNQDKQKRKMIERYLPRRQKLMAQDFNQLQKEEISSWINAEKIYLQEKIVTTYNVQRSWNVICDKMNALARQYTMAKLFDSHISINDNTYLALLWFFHVIFPKNGANDSEFGPQHIDTLIRFKYGLSPQAKDALIDQALIPE